MGVSLWHFFFEDDVESFRRFLASATLSSGPQRTTAGHGTGNASFKIGSPGNLAVSPKTPVKSRKSAGHAQSGIGGSNTKTAAVVLTRADVNAKDVFGRTLLHHIASSSLPTAIEFASALLAIPFLDLYAQDTESGWTALHRALYRGNVAVAQALMLRDIKDATDYTTTVSHTHAGGLIKIKDNEGNSPFEVFGLTIASRLLETGTPRRSVNISDDNSSVSGDLNNEDDDEESKQKRLVKPLFNIEGDEAYAFGSNKNLSLGLGDEDDRQYPERLVFGRPEHLLHRLHEEHKFSRQKATAIEDLGSSQLDIPQDHDIPAVIRHQTLTIQEVIMSKLHTAVLTNDPVSNLFICGFGPGGRLGTGDEVTRFNYVCIQTGGLAKSKIVATALGQDHTIAISSKGEVFTWGSNRYGQLGYSLPETSTKETPMQLIPRQLYGHVKKELVVGAAASAIHSAIFTSTALYTFGKNEGQLGLMGADAGSLEMQILPRRIGASVLQSPILMVSAIDRATAVLLENHEVIVFTHYGFKKVDDFPFQTHRNYSLRLAPNAICKVTAGGNTISALSTYGEVFSIEVAKYDAPSTSGSTTNPNKAKNALTIPAQVWAIKKAHMCAVDVAVGQDGSIILCTGSGSVWRKEKRANIKSVSSREPASARSKDYKFVRVPNLTRAVAVRSNAFGAFIAVRRDCSVTREQIYVDPPTLWENLFPMLPFYDYKENEDTADPKPRFWTPASKEYSPAQVKSAILQATDAEAHMKIMMSKYEPLSDSPYDLWITSNMTDVRIPMHAFLVKGRSNVLRRALTDFQRTYYYSIPDLLCIEYGSDGQIQIKFQGADFFTLLNLVLYLYTEHIIEVWPHLGKIQYTGQRNRQVRTELMKIATQLDLRQLERDVRVMVVPSKSLNFDMEAAICDPDFFSDHDLLVELADDVEVPAHSALLCARCPFFDALFRGAAGGQWMASRKSQAEESAEAMRVDLKHVDAKVFEVVLRHIYADTGEELFDEAVSDDLDSFLDLVIEVMSVANELMLDRLAQVCQKVLGKFVTTRNICSLLNVVAECSVPEFKHVGLEYICLNLEGMLEHRFLEELDPDLLLELDETVQSNQHAYMPFARSGKGLADMLTKDPELSSRIEECRKRRVDSMRLRTRYNEVDEDRTASGNKFRVGSWDKDSSSPLVSQARRSSSKHPSSPASSPAIKPMDSEHDLPFEMDDENALNTRASGLGIDMSSPTIRPRDSSYPASPSFEPGGWFDARGKPIVSSIGTDASSLATSHRQSTSSKSRTAAPQASVKIEGFGSSPPAWKTTSQSLKSNFRDIMTQASLSSRTSTLTQAMNAGSFEVKTSGKISQKERKKMQQQQRSVSAQEVPLPTRPQLAPSQAVTSPWQKVESAPKANLKDVIAANDASTRPSIRPPARTTMTMRQTVARAPPPTSSGQPSRSASTPTVNLSPKPPPAATQIHSIRHILPTSSSSLDTPSSMAEILVQQDLEKRAVREAVQQKRSLVEIQVEEEFLAWFDGESRRVQEEEAAEARKEQMRGQPKGRGKGGRGAGRGKGGRGRGGGENSKVERGGKA